MPDYLYPLDLTGRLASNYITGEQHVVTEANFQNYFFIVPKFAPFYANGLIVKHLSSTNVVTTLVEGVDYYTALPYVGATRSLGQPVYGAISLNTLDPIGIVSISYQTLGGEWLADIDQVLVNLTERIYNPRTTIWDIVTDKTNQFPPIDHTHDADQLYGQQELIDAINNISISIVNNRNEIQVIKHLVNEENPHHVTLPQLGYDVATVEETKAGVLAASFVTPYTLKPVVDQINTDINIVDIKAIEVTDNFNAHSITYDNPHHTTLSQLELTIATTDNIVEGVQNNSLVTPYSLKPITDKIDLDIATHYDEFVVLKDDYNSHITNITNPHQVTLSQLGYRVAVITDLGTDNATAFITPLVLNTVQTTISNNYTYHTNQSDITNLRLTSHINSLTNPHNTTLLSLGYTLSSNSDVVTGTALDKLITPYALKPTLEHYTLEINTIKTDIVAIKSQIEIHTGSHSNPHHVTLSQIGYGIAVTNDIIVGTSNTSLITPRAINPLYTQITDSIIFLEGQIIALSNEINQHISDYNNPHDVNKTDVGLSNVPNLELAIALNITNRERLDKFVTLKQVLELLDGYNFEHDKPILSYNIIPQSLEVCENTTLNVQISTSEVADGTVLYWEIDHISTTNDDFLSTNGNFSIYQNAANFTITISPDAVTSTIKVFRIYLKSIDALGSLVAISANINIVDTPVSDVITVVESTHYAKSGSIVNFTIDSLLKPDNTALFWKLQILSGASASFQTTQGSVILYNKTAQASVKVINKLTYPTKQYFKLQVFDKQLNGTLLAESDTIIVKRGFKPIDALAACHIYDSYIPQIPKAIFISNSLKPTQESTTRHLLPRTGGTWIGGKIDYIQALVVKDVFVSTNRLNSRSIFVTESHSTPNRLLIDRTHLRGYEHSIDFVKALLVKDNAESIKTSAGYYVNKSNHPEGNRYLGHGGFKWHSPKSSFAQILSAGSIFNNKVSLSSQSFFIINSLNPDYNKKHILNRLKSNPTNYIDGMMASSVYHLKNELSSTGMFISNSQNHIERLLANRQLRTWVAPKLNYTDAFSAISVFDPKVPISGKSLLVINSLKLANVRVRDPRCPIVAQKDTSKTIDAYIDCIFSNKFIANTVGYNPRSLFVANSIDDKPYRHIKGVVPKNKYPYIRALLAIDIYDPTVPFNGRSLFITQSLKSVNNMELSPSLNIANIQAGDFLSMGIMNPDTEPTPARFFVVNSLP